jgi:hypothetical protein
VQADLHQLLDADGALHSAGLEIVEATTRAGTKVEWIIRIARRRIDVPELTRRAAVQALQIPIACPSGSANTAIVVSGSCVTGISTLPPSASARRNASATSATPT